jgi:hypothetical protein
LNDEDKTVDSINNNEEDFLTKEKILVFSGDKNLFFLMFLMKIVWDKSHLNTLDKEKKFSGQMRTKKT